MPEKTYTRDEVIEILKQFSFECAMVTSNELHNWIDENL